MLSKATNTGQPIIEQMKHPKSITNDEIKNERKESSDLSKLQNEYCMSKEKALQIIISIDKKI